MNSNSKLREAVESLLDLLDDFAITEEIVLIAHEKQLYRETLHTDKTLAVLRKAKAALAEPPRNCDVGTVEDQYNRFVYSCTSGKIPCRKSELCSCTNCYAEWAQLSYEGNESEVDNENNEKK